MAKDYSSNFKIAMTGYNGLGNITDETVLNVTDPATTDPKTGKPTTGTPKTGDPKDPKSQQLVYEDYYKNSAKLLHYKTKLNEKLKEKNPEAFANYFSGLGPVRRKGDDKLTSEYIENSQWNDYLTPQEVQQTLGKQDYKDYLDSLQIVNKFNVAQGRQPLYGNIEGENDINNLNYGRRFASLAVNTRFGLGGDNHYARQYTYDPNKRDVVISEEGNVKYRPKEFTPL